MSQHPVSQVVRQLRSRGFRRTAVGVYGMAIVISVALVYLLVGLAIGLFNVEAWDWVTAMWMFPAATWVPSVPATVAFIACIHYFDGERLRTRLHDIAAVLLTILVATWLTQGVYLGFRIPTSLPWIALASPLTTVVWVLAAGAFGFGLSFIGMAFRGELRVK